MRVLVTGGNGFIGRWVCGELNSRGHDAVVLDHSGLADWLADVRDAVATNEAIAHMDGVIHLAGILGTQETIAHPRPAVDTNIIGGLNVLEACAQYQVPLVNIAVGNYTERSTYSITKTCVDSLCDMYARYRSTPVPTVRAYNAYGPGQSAPVPYGTSRVRKIIPSFTCRVLHGEPLEIYGDGSQVMDMIHVADVARVLTDELEALASGGKPHRTEAGTARATTVTEIAQLVLAEVERQTGLTGELRYLPMRPGETPGGVVLASESVPSATSLEQGLPDTVR